MGRLPGLCLETDLRVVGILCPFCAILEKFDGKFRIGLPGNEPDFPHRNIGGGDRFSAAGRFQFKAGPGAARRQSNAPFALFVGCGACGVLPELDIHLAASRSIAFEGMFFRILLKHGIGGKELVELECDLLCSKTMDSDHGKSRGQKGFQLHKSLLMK